MIFEDINILDIIDFIPLFKKEVDFSKDYKFKIRAQSIFPNCSIHAWITCIEYLRQIDGYEYENFSILYHYYMTRVLSNCEGKLKGVHIESSLESLFLNGAIISSNSKLINDDTINKRPSKNEINEACKRIINKNIIKKKLQINLNVFKYILSEIGVPFVVVLNTTKDKLHNSDASIFINDVDDILNSLHAICIIGYNDEEQVFIFQNSYGKKWHYNGFGKLHYSYLTNITKAISIERSCIKSDEINEINFIDILDDILFE